MKIAMTTAVGLALALGLSACSGSAEGEGDSGSDEPIVIGMPVGLSGFASGLDGPFVTGAEVAVDDINAAGGVLGRQLEIIKSDTKSDPAQAGTAAQKLIDEGADFILPTVDYDLGGPAARVAQSAGLVSMTLAGDTRFGKAGIGDLAFNISAGGANEGAAAATFAADQGWEEPYFLEDTSLGYSTSFCKYFRESWAAKTGVDPDSIQGDTFKNSDTSVAGQISRLRSASPEPGFVVMCSYPPGGAAATKQIRASGVDQPMIGGVAFDGTFWLSTVPNESDFYVMGGGVVTGTDPDPARAEVFAGYEEKTGEAPTQGAWPLAGYSAVEAIAQAIEQAESTDSAEVADALETFTDVPLAIGSTTWTEDCHVSVDRANVAIRMVDGSEEFIDMVTPTDIPDAVC